MYIWDHEASNMTGGELGFAPRIPQKSSIIFSDSKSKRKEADVDSGYLLHSHGIDGSHGP